MDALTSEKPRSPKRASAVPKEALEDQGASPGASLPEIIIIDTDLHTFHSALATGQSECLDQVITPDGDIDVFETAFSLPRWIRSAILSELINTIEHASGYRKQKYLTKFDSPQPVPQTTPISLPKFLACLETESPTLSQFLGYLLKQSKEAIEEAVVDEAASTEGGGTDTDIIVDLLFLRDLRGKGSLNEDESQVLSVILQAADSLIAQDQPTPIQSSGNEPTNNSRGFFSFHLSRTMDPLEDMPELKELSAELGYIWYEIDSAERAERYTSQVERCLTSSFPSKFRIQIDWNPMEIILSLIKNPAMAGESTLPSLGSVLTLTGSPNFAYAETCLTYAQQNWPHVASLTLELLDKLVLEERYRILRRFSQQKEVQEKSIRLRYTMPGNPSEQHGLVIQLAGVSTKVVVKGAPNHLIQISQLLRWLSCSLRLSPSGNPAACYIPRDATDGAIMRAFGYSIPVNQGSSVSACWIPLLPQAIIAEGFPIPPRSYEKGLEIPLHIASGLIGASHASEYCGGVVIKGFSSMLVPLETTSLGIQWHVISSKDEDTPLSYEEGIALCPNRAMISQVPIGSIFSARAFIGWHRQVVSYLGRDPREFEYAIIRDSHAGTPGSRISLEKLTIGFQQIATAQVNISRIPQAPSLFHVQRRRYGGIVKLAENTQVLLYDSNEKRAWLVTAAEVILHMAQYRLREDEEHIEIDASGSPSEALVRNAHVEIEYEYTFQDMVKNTWDLLEFLQNDLKVKAKAKSSSWLKNILLGYEFRSCLEERSSFTIRQMTLSHEAEGWASMVRSIGALVLFGRGFGDLIKPTEHGDLCPLWRTVPCGKDLMATTVGVLQQIYDQIPAEGSRQYLTASKLEWHRGDSLLFEPCSAPHDTCNCQRAQRLVTASSLRRVRPPGTLAPGGGVIFGEGVNFRRSEHDGGNGLAVHLLHISRVIQRSPEYQNIHSRDEELGGFSFEDSEVESRPEPSGAMG